MKKTIIRALAGLMIITLMGCSNAGNTDESDTGTNSNSIEQTDSPGSDALDSSKETDQPSETEPSDRKSVV